MKPAGPGHLFVGVFPSTNSISLVVILLIFCICFQPGLEAPVSVGVCPSRVYSVGVQAFVTFPAVPLLSASGVGLPPLSLPTLGLSAFSLGWPS